MLIALAAERAMATPLVLPNDLLEFLGDRYLELPAATRLRISFERYLVDYRVRNGALFEKFHCPAVRQRHQKNFRVRREA